MIDRRIGPVEAQPNVLRDQTVPNTLRSQPGAGASGKQGLNSGGGRAGPRRARTRPVRRLWMYVALAVLAVVVALFLLSVPA